MMHLPACYVLVIYFIFIRLTEACSVSQSLNV
jgi:hypothetical protein